MNAGDTFFFSGHLWMLISDPDQDPTNIVGVNFTTLTPRHDQACVVNTGDHPFLRHQSCVNYYDALLFSEDGLAALIDLGRARPDQPLSQDLLQRIRDRAGESDLPLDFLGILRAQGLIAE